MQRVWLVLTLVALACSPASAAGADGTWRGTLQRGAASLPVELVLTAAPSAKSTFTAPDLGAVGVPLANVRLGDAVHWELVGDTSRTSFDGRLAGDTIEGTFQDPAGPGTFSLRRAGGADERPYATEDVSFSNGSVRLAGTVVVPRSPGPHRAAVLVQGSGPEGRWAMMPLADALARSGIESLVFDKRGVGGSSGDWRTATPLDLAGDVRAAVHLLARRAEVDPAKLGIYGHSQGAQIAPAAARNDPAVRWIVAADGPVGPAYLQDLFRVRNVLARKYAGRELAAAMKVYTDFVTVARNGLPHAALRAEIARAHGAPWLDDLAIPPDDSYIWTWYRGVGNYDNRGAWASVRVPVLLVYGGDDRLVPTQPSIDEIAAILRVHGDAQVSAVVYPGADHTLRIPPRSPGDWPRYAPDYPAAVVRWIEKV